LQTVQHYQKVVTVIQPRFEPWAG